MKRCSRIISFFLALTLLIGLLPGSLVIPAFAAVEPKYVVSSNIELTEDTNSTTAPALKKSYITNDVIDKSKGQVFLPSKTNFRLHMSKLMVSKYIFRILNDTPV